MIVAVRWDRFVQSVREVISRPNFHGGLVYAFEKKERVDKSPVGAEAMLQVMENEMAKSLSQLNKGYKMTEGVLWGHYYPKYVFRRVPVANVLGSGGASGVYLFFAVRVIRLEAFRSIFRVECASVDGAGVGEWIGLDDGLPGSPGPLS